MATIADLADAITRQEGNNFGNNPGNLMYAGQYGATKNANGFAVFSSPELGRLALERQIALDAIRGKTLASFLGGYAPPSENDTATYIKNVSSWTGIQPTDKLADVLGQNAVTDFFATTPQDAGTLDSFGGDWFTSAGDILTTTEIVGIPLWAWLAVGVVGVVLVVGRD
jgi:hypothetical protein